MEIIENRIKTLEEKMKKTEKDMEELKNGMNSMDREMIEIKLVSQKDIKQIFKSLEKMEKQNSQSLSRIESIYEKISEDVDNLKFKPVAKWENVTKTIITVITTGVITYLISGGGF